MILLLERALRLAVICFASGGYEDDGSLAARVVEAHLAQSGQRVLRYDCVSAAGVAHDIPGTRRTVVTSRRFINDMQRAGVLHDHVLVDLSIAPDMLSAIAFSLADLVLIPLDLENFEQASMMRTLQLIETVSANHRKPLQHTVFLSGTSDKLSPSIMLKISALLMLRGLHALPVPLIETDARTYLAHPCHATRPEPDRRPELSRLDPFAQGILDLLPAEQTCGDSARMIAQ